MNSIHINNNQQVELSDEVDKNEAAVGVAEVAVNIAMGFKEKEVKKVPECKISEGISEALIALNEVMKNKEDSEPKNIEGRRFSCKHGDTNKEGNIF